MAVTVWEDTNSPQWTDGNQKSARARWHADGDDDYATVMTAVAGAIPSTFEGLALRNIALRPNGNDNLWIAEIDYAEPGKLKVEPKEVGESEYSFDTTGGTFRATQSKETTNAYGAHVVGSFGGAINVNGDNVDGTDIVVPQYAFEEKHVIAAASVTNTYKGYLFALTGRTNNATFKGFAIGECLFLGARGTQRGDGNWEITFRFACSPNATGIAVGSLTGIAKKGWEYLWTRYETAYDSTAKTLVRKPVSVLIERVYDSGDFSLLGIGTT